MIVMNIFVSSPDATLFSDQLTKAICEIQKEGLNVEVQYQPLIANTNQVIYSALLLGRSKGE